MDVRLLSKGEWIAAAGGILLLVSLFLPWYSAGGSDANAWETMAVDDVIFAVAAVLGVAGAVVVAIPRLAGFSVAAMSLAVFVGLLTLILVVVRLLSPAPEADVSLELGAWLGLLGAIGLLAGALLGARDEGPARRTPAAERAATQAGIARAELLPLPPDVGSRAGGSGAG